MINIGASRYVEKRHNEALATTVNAFAQYALAFRF